MTSRTCWRNKPDIGEKIYAQPVEGRIHILSRKGLIASKTAIGGVVDLKGVNMIEQGD